MHKENLFNLIRNEEVVIWAGAGLSLYAGYPSGKTLGEVLYSNLSESEKNIINPNSTLPDLAEEIYRIKGGNKNYIIKTLKNIFEIESTSTETHQLISKIPHFKTIITTNYDKLFENAYKNKANLILNHNNLPYIRKDQTQIFKVHGDLSSNENIIITKTDYNRFFQDQSEHNSFWTVIKERLTTNSILFLGYNLEDPNISVIFDKITENLGDHRKECFLVAPDLPEHKVGDLARKGIKYINSTAEEILCDLVHVLKENIVNDLETKIVSADTFKKFLQNFDLLPSFDATKESYNVRSIRGIDGNQVEGKINFTIKNEENMVQKYYDFAQGKEFGELELDENILQNVDLYYGDIRLSQKDKIVKLKFQSTPKFDTKVTIRFENDYEFEDFPVKLFGNKNLIEIHSKLKSADLKFKFNIENYPNLNFKFTYKHDTVCTTTKNELELFKLLKNFSEGNTFTVFIEEGKKIKQKFEKFQDLLDEMNFFINYFENLQLIEKNFNIQFKNFNFDEITDDSSTILTNVNFIY